MANGDLEGGLKGPSKVRCLPVIFLREVLFSLFDESIYSSKIKLLEESFPGFQTIVIDLPFFPAKRIKIFLVPQTRLIKIIVVSLLNGLIIATTTYKLH